ncbi:hypothetical protein DFQ28_005903 [Apophysomyces sp. BC1034]|nr:hypothetical protein DFQ30_003451 [Apophysomyces sp. BC1015]KAG0180339.1 hypothetical protein DFQ29_000865 [Apophysomyces sp. BC1021]KAG0187760.1 hypothetical protein DFQ28_005903 [Apophysomyces sp. BC1034]
MVQEGSPEAVAADIENNVHKVFVGNLSFQTTEEGLTKCFEDSGKVLGADIIKRGRRSIGYGFVSFATAEEAENALKELDKKELDGREINVEIARPKNSDRPRRPRKTGRRVSHRRRSHDEDEGGQTLAVDEEGKDMTEKRRKKGRDRRLGRRNSTRRPMEMTDASKSTLFVGNLPWSTTDENLADLFKDFQVKSAHVARIRSRSKGYGFVELESEEEQKKALEDFENVVLENRVIYIKVALFVVESKKSEDERQEDTEPIKKELNTETTTNKKLTEALDEKKAEPQKKQKKKTTEKKEEEEATN